MSASQPKWTGALTDVAAVNEHIRAWQSVVGPDGWEIRFSPNPPDDDDTRASHDIDAVMRRGAIRIRADAPGSQVDRLIVHELLHANFAFMEDTFNRALTEHGESAAAFLRGQWTRSQEWLIERLASLVTGGVVEQWQDDDVWASAFPASVDAT